MIVKFENEVFRVIEIANQKAERMKEDFQDIERRSRIIFNDEAVKYFDAWIAEKVEEGFLEPYALYLVAREWEWTPESKDPVWAINLLGTGICKETDRVPLVYREGKRLEFKQGAIHNGGRKSNMPPADSVYLRSEPYARAYGGWMYVNYAVL